ncbi:hypothetical protein GWK47_054493 [Chionoecetes opilio]|uniref:Uncharacterized protein n=1 Tax=Chionoecetes opilio TaxID=41210 RepID=A0A8J5C7D6_CHIOP|nr:hypothetical protein GWK47_054493 [Chionoecetes opilio]
MMHAGPSECSSLDRLVTIARRMRTSPHLEHRIYAKAALAMAMYLKKPGPTPRLCPRHPFATLLAFLRYPPLWPTGFNAWLMLPSAWIIADLVLCDPDAGRPSQFRRLLGTRQDLPVILPSRTHPKQQLPALLRQESLATIRTLSTPATRLYFTDASAGENAVWFRLCQCALSDHFVS